MPVSRKNFHIFTVPLGVQNFLKDKSRGNIRLIKEKSSVSENFFQKLRDVLKEKLGLFVGSFGYLAFAGGAVGQVEEGAQGAPAEEAGIGDQGKGHALVGGMASIGALSMMT
jgi:hypothetical protein